MEYSEFRRHLGKAGISVGQFAELIGVRPRSVSNHAQGSVPEAYAVIAVLMGDAADMGHDFKAVLARFGLPIHQHAGARNVRHLEDFKARRGVKR